MSPNTLYWIAFLSGWYWFLVYLRADRLKNEFLMLVSLLSGQFWFGLSFVFSVIKSIS